MKGIVLAGGRGSRLYPLTMAGSKQLLPIYDKPMIYYPLSVLFLAGIREILIIATPEDIPRFQELLQDGSQFGVSFEYREQSSPRGIADAFLIGADFIEEERVALVLGDNIFHGQNMDMLCSQLGALQEGGMVFGYEVSDPGRYGVLAFDSYGMPCDICEKPSDPPSQYAVTGLYAYDSSVVAKARNLSPSSRGELEITDINRAYMAEGALQVRFMERGFAWLDTGTHSDLFNAASYVRTIQERQGIQIACLEEIAYKQGFIGLEALEQAADRFKGSAYGQYIAGIERAISKGAFGECLSSSR